MSIINFLTFPMTPRWTSQSGQFRAIFNNFAENDHLPCGFQLSKYRARSLTSLILFEFINRS